MQTWKISCQAHFSEKQTAVSVTVLWTLLGNLNARKSFGVTDMQQWASSEEFIYLFD